MTPDVKVPAQGEPLAISSREIRAEVAIVLATVGGLDAATALRLAGAAAERIRLSRTRVRAAESERAAA